MLQVRLEDQGVYICYANNSAGEESVRVSLEVTASLSVHVQPQVQVVDVGKEASFQCIIGGYPVTQVTWLHNTKPVAPDGRLEVMADPPRITIKQLSKDDRGMYQCVVSNNWDQMQAIAELDMGDAGPELNYWFSEQTLQPGPTVSLKCVAAGMDGEFKSSRVCLKAPTSLQFHLRGPRAFLSAAICIPDFPRKKYIVRPS